MEPSLVTKAPHELVCLVTGTDNGQDIWHYILLDKYKIPALNEALAAGELDVTQFGTVIISGWGKAPPVEIAEAVKKKYE